MARRPRRNHQPQFKAKVALEALKGELILPTNDGHPGKRVNYATEVNHDIKDKQDKDNP